MKVTLGYNLGAYGLHAFCCEICTENREHLKVLWNNDHLKDKIVPFDRNAPPVDSGKIVYFPWWMRSEGTFKGSSDVFPNYSEADFYRDDLAKEMAMHLENARIKDLKDE